MFNKRESPKSQAGRAGEDRALQHLLRQGLRLVERNYRVAAGPGARAGEVDLIMRDERDGTLVFVEVRVRADASHGGAAASVTRSKQQRLLYAAQHYLLRHATPPPCRFDVVALDGQGIEWLQAAFDTSR